MLRAQASILRAACVATFALAFAAPRVAHADVSSWFAVGSGLSVQRDGRAATTELVAPLSLSLGVGSSPRSSFVVGGLFRSVTHFGLGTDLSMAVRVATGGFARGDWGIALDAGMVARWWNGGDFGRYPFQGVVTLGGPWGLQVALGAQLGSVDDAPGAKGAIALLELDLLRLTVMRQGSTDAIWFNPAPAGGRAPKAEWVPPSRPGPTSSP